jgi:hypothetical protein
MPLSFGPLGKAIALLVAVALALWMIYTYVFATDEVADEAEQTGAIEMVVTPSA